MRHLADEKASPNIRKILDLAMLRLLCYKFYKAQVSLPKVDIGGRSIIPWIVIAEDSVTGEKLPQYYFQRDSNAEETNAYRQFPINTNRVIHFDGSSSTFIRASKDNGLIDRFSEAAAEVHHKKVNQILIATWRNFDTDSVDQQLLKVVQMKGQKKLGDELFVIDSGKLHPITETDLTIQKTLDQAMKSIIDVDLSGNTNQQVSLELDDKFVKLNDHNRYFTHLDPAPVKFTEVSEIEFNNGKNQAEDFLQVFDYSRNKKVYFKKDVRYRE